MTDGSPLMKADGSPQMTADGTPRMGTAGDPCCCNGNVKLTFAGILTQSCFNSGSTSFSLDAYVAGVYCIPIATPISGESTFDTGETIGWREYSGPNCTGTILRSGTSTVVIYISGGYGVNSSIAMTAVNSYGGGNFKLFVFTGDLVEQTALYDQDAPYTNNTHTYGSVTIGRCGYDPGPTGKRCFALWEATKANDIWTQELQNTGCLPFDPLYPTYWTDSDGICKKRIYVWGGSCTNASECSEVVTPKLPTGPCGPNAGGAAPCTCPTGLMNSYSVAISAVSSTYWRIPAQTVAVSRPNGNTNCLWEGTITGVQVYSGGSWSSGIRDSRLSVTLITSAPCSWKFHAFDLVSGAWHSWGNKTTGQTPLGSYAESLTSMGLDGATMTATVN